MKPEHYEGDWSGVGPCGCELCRTRVVEFHLVVVYSLYDWTLVAEPAEVHPVWSVNGAGEVVS